jgi:hypothetical protein
VPGGAEASKQLYWVWNNWEQLQAARDGKKELTDEILSAQINLPGQIHPDPQSLAEAMIVARMKRRQ